MGWVWRYAYPPSLGLIVGGGILTALGLGLGAGWLRPTLLAAGGLAALIYVTRWLLYAAASWRRRRRRKRRNANR